LVAVRYQCSALYEQGKIHHVGGFPELEDQLCTWEKGTSDSPDRLDALVHALTELKPGAVLASEPWCGRRTSRWAGAFQRAGDGRGGF
jgi:phage terminase large subunit-like protein